MLVCENVCVNLGLCVCVFRCDTIYKMRPHALLRL